MGGLAVLDHNIDSLTPGKIHILATMENCLSDSPI